MNPKLIAPILLAAFILWAVYRRARRLIGRQHLRAGRLRVRIGVLAIVGCVAAAEAARGIPMLVALGTGVLCGAMLGYVGLRLTRFEVTPEGRFYTPHAYLGLAVIVLFLGREVYEILGVYHGALFVAAAARDARGIPLRQTPASLAAFGAVVGYYIFFYVGVLQRARLSAAFGNADGIEQR